jgi:MSHA biogenesis protein MshJ
MRLDKQQLQKWYDNLEKWWEKHPHQERVWLIILLWGAIIFVWYVFFEKPFADTRKDVAARFSANMQQIAGFQKEMVHARTEGEKFLTRQKILAAQKKLLPPIDFASEKDSERIIQTMLTPKNNIKFVSLKVQPAESKTLSNKQTIVTKNQVGISFVSNYFDTMAYLTALEALPWCLTWDSLDYKVNTYPDAQVSINLHIVNS